ncbi:MAG: sugar ABC transporter ATP-binding protein [Verrucomicrobiota bacterium]
MRLQAIGIDKRYGATHALRAVQLAVAAGEIHALLGENGAGKSTLVNILGGAERADRGLILLDGQPFAPQGPIQARREGVAIVCQNANLAGDLSVEENLVLGGEPARRGWINRRQRREWARAALAELASEDIPLGARVGALSYADQQRVEIARALLVDPKVLILDEPTRSLSHWEIAPLFAALRRMAARGIAILSVSHFLEESLALCSRYTVLRDGEVMASGAMQETDRAGLIRQMAGCEIREGFPRSRRHLGRPLLQLKHVSGQAGPHGIDLTLHEGEILGLAGLDGAGRSQTLRAIFGLARLREGEIWREGKRSRRPAPTRRWHTGIGMVGESRLEGILPSLSIADNLTLTCLGRFSAMGFLNTERQNFAALDWMEKLRIRARSPRQEVRTLSGGNQQKVLLGRLLLHRAGVLLLDEPTRGIDVRTKAQIYELIDAIAAEGKGILLVSSDPAELLGLCDTVALLRQGRLVEMRPAKAWSEPEIIAAAMGPP